MQTNYVTTDRFSGKCDTCVYPIVREVQNATGDTMSATCPECGTKVTLERLYGSFSNHNCDARCQYALGNICVCACGGRNHRAGYIAPTFDGFVPAATLSRYRKAVAKAQAVGQARRQRNAQKKADALAEAVAEWLSVWDDEGSPLASAMVGETDLAAAFGLEGYGLNTVSDIRRKFLQAGTLSPRQISFATDLVLKAVRNAERKAQEDAEPKITLQPGRQTVTGTVVFTKGEEGDYGFTMKAMIKGEGFRLWGTLPKGAAKGDTIMFDAQVQPKEEGFGFYKRPTKVVVLAKAEEGGQEAPQGTSLDAPAEEAQEVAQALQAAQEAVSADPNACTPGQKCQDILSMCSKHSWQYQMRYGRAANE